MWQKIKEIKPETWARTICFILALINQVLAVLGRNQIKFVESDVYQIVSAIFTVVTGIIAWWKNNSFTKAAIQADVYLDELRAKAVAEELEHQDFSNID